MEHGVAETMVTIDPVSNPPPPRPLPAGGRLLQLNFDANQATGCVLGRAEEAWTSHPIPPTPVLPAWVEWGRDSRQAMCCTDSQSPA